MRRLRLPRQPHFFPPALLLYGDESVGRSPGTQTHSGARTALPSPPLTQLSPHLKSADLLAHIGYIISTTAVFHKDSIYHYLEFGGCNETHVSNPISFNPVITIS